MTAVSTTPQISVILVTRNSLRDIGPCLDALPAAADGLGFEVLVVDNASQDGTVAWLQRWQSQQAGRCLIARPHNEGLARAANRAAARARAQRLAVLNPDVVAGPGSLASLATALDAEPDLGLVLPRLVDADGRLQHSCRTFYDLPTVIARRAPLLRRWLASSTVVRRHLMLDWDHAEARDVDWGQGAAMLMKREALPRPDRLFDPRYFLYFEDVDLAWSLWNRGWRVRYVPGVTMVHGYRRQSAALLSRTALWHLASGAPVHAQDARPPAARP